MRNIVVVVALALAGCGSASEPTEPSNTVETTGEEAPPPGEAAPARASMTAEECESAGGAVVGDIGDGATQPPDYICPSGQPPLGTIPVGIEGSVCCPE